MDKQIETSQVRAALVVIKDFVPMLNNLELTQLMEFFKKVIIRLDEEEAYKIEEKRTQK